jgi:hypothetical protein
VSVDRLLDEAQARSIEGWDFSWLGDRIGTTDLPWNFDDLVVRHARRSPDLLDMGTGGGEWLSALSYRPPRTVATESWRPNVEVARDRLGPFGITVVVVEPAIDNVEQEPDEQRGRLPFPAASFSLLVNRHESFLASEIARVLTARGTFLTQQVGGDWSEFYDALGLPGLEEKQLWDRALATRQLEAAGLRVVDGGDGIEVVSFRDIGAFAWYLKANPWIVEGFSVEAHRSRLTQLQERLETEGPLTIGQPAFWIKALKGA